MTLDFKQQEVGSVESFGSSKVDFSKPLLVMEAIRICFKLRAVEMRSGYTSEKLDKYGNVSIEVIPDSRNAFISSIKALRSLLSPEKDKTFKTFEEGFSKDLEKTFIKYGYRNILFKDFVDPNDRFKNKKLIPYIKEDESYVMPSLGSTTLLLSSDNQTLIPVKGGWDNRSNSYIEDVIELYDLMFSELNDLVFRIGYFKKESKGEREKK